MRPDARKLRAHGNDTPLVATCPDSHSEVTMEGVNPVGLNLIFDITNETPVPGGRQLLSSRMRQRGCPFVSFSLYRASSLCRMVTFSTWKVCGKRSTGVTLTGSNTPSSRKRARSRASVAGSQET